MKSVCLLIFLSGVFLEVQAKPPSRAAVISCLSAKSISAATRWTLLPDEKIYSEPDYMDGFNAIYYIKSGSKAIGYAERGQIKAILYGNQLFPLDKAQPLLGFAPTPTELDPFVAEWSVVTDRGTNFLCISFPYGDLGLSGSFQKNRSAYLLAMGKARTPRTLYSATGNLDALVTHRDKHR